MQNESCVHLSEFLREKRDDISTSPYTMGVFAVCYSLIIVSGIIGNLCTILAICRTRSLQTVPNMFILSLSCSDIVVCCTSATITPITAFKKNWIFGSLLCSVAPFIAGVSLCFSTFTLATISIDRFILIRFPMKKPLSHAQASVAILMICVLAVVLCTPIMLAQDLDGFGDYCGMFCYENWGVHQSLKRVYGTLLITLQFIVPLIIIIFCYTAISVRLGQSLILKGGPKSKKGNEWQPAMTEQQKAANKRRQRTNRMFIAMVLAFSFSWFANILFNVLRDYDMLPPFVKKQEFFYGILTHCIAMTSTVWNPLLYAALNFQLRAAFIQLMPICIKEFFHLRVSSGRPTTTIVDGRRSQLNGGGTGRFGTSNTRTAHNGTPRPLQCYSPVGMLNGSAVSGGSGLLIANENALDDADERSVLGTVTNLYLGRRAFDCVTCFRGGEDNDGSRPTTPRTQSIPQMASTTSFSSKPLPRLQDPLPEERCSLPRDEVDRSSRVESQSDNVDLSPSVTTSPTTDTMTAAGMSSTPLVRNTETPTTVRWRDSSDSSEPLAPGCPQTAEVDSRPDDIAMTNSTTTTFENEAFGGEDVLLLQTSVTPSSTEESIRL